MSKKGSSTIASTTKINVGESSRKADIKQRCIQSTSLRPGRTDHDSGRTKFERVRQFGRKDGAFRSIGIQLVDFENCFQIWWTKYKRVRPNKFRKCI